MAAITLAVAQAQLDAYLAAEVKILKGQAVEIDGQRLTRADLDSVQKGVAFWQKQVVGLSASAAGGRRTRTLIVQG